MEYEVDTFSSVLNDGSVVESHDIEECFEDGTQEGNPVVIAELTAENPKYYGKLYENAEFMLQICKDLNGYNFNSCDSEKLDKLTGLQNRARTILTSLNIPL